MPAPRAYTSEEVIAVGLAVEANGPVTSRSLHHALGLKGDPSTAIRTWERFVAQRDRLCVAPAGVENDPMSGPANTFLQQIQALGLEFARTVREDTAAIYERRAGFHVQQIDDLLSRSEAQEEEIAFLRSQLPALRAPED